MLFCDIRGYTSFAERHDPETVVEVLNLYFQHQADFVAKHQGDVDKFVGDQIVAVFQGEDMARNAVRCALEIQAKTDELGREHPDWDLDVGIGINTGEVIVGAMGSKDRMDYTVLGDHVNLAARLCSHAAPGQTLVTGSAYRGDRGLPRVRRRGAGADRGQGQARAGAGLPGPAGADRRRAAPARQRLRSAGRRAATRSGGPALSGRAPPLTAGIALDGPRQLRGRGNDVDGARMDDRVLRHVGEPRFLRALHHRDPAGALDRRQALAAVPQQPGQQDPDPMLTPVALHLPRSGAAAAIFLPGCGR